MARIGRCCNYCKPVGRLKKKEYLKLFIIPNKTRFVKWYLNIKIKEDEKDIHNKHKW